MINIMISNTMMKMIGKISEKKSNDVFNIIN